MFCWFLITNVRKNVFLDLCRCGGGLKLWISSSDLCLWKNSSPEKTVFVKLTCLETVFWGGAAFLNSEVLGPAAERQAAHGPLEEGAGNPAAEPGGVHLRRREAQRHLQVPLHVPAGQRLLLRDPRCAAAWPVALKLKFDQLISVYHETGHG